MYSVGVFVFSLFLFWFNSPNKIVFYFILLLVRREDESSLRVQSHGSLLFVGHHEDAQEKEEAAGSL
jgi:hypothetical protein